jgi:RHS repeat-associated protein
VAEEQVADIDPLRFTYDGVGRPVAITQGPRTSILSYDAQGRLASITDALSRVAGFDYDLGGRLTRQILPDGRKILYSYDANGNLTSTTPPGRPTHAFTYTAVDLEEAYLPPDIGTGAHPTQYIYNLDRQLTQVARPDGTTIDLGYDGAGRLNTLTHPHGQVTFGYHHATGHLTTIIAPDGESLAFVHDGNLLTQETWSGAIAGSVQYVYDPNFRLISQSINGDTPVIFQYDLDGLLTNVGAFAIGRDAQNGLITGSILGNISDSRAYNSFGEITSYRGTFNGRDLFAVQFTRDLLGRITQKVETVEGQTNTYSYVYDAAGRLTTVQRNGSPVATYAYDSNGNRLSYTDSNGSLTGTYDVQDRLIHYGPNSYTYTPNGDLQGKTRGGQATTYAYNALGNLQGVTLPDGTQVAYVIDGRNRRVGKKVNGTLVQGFLYEGALAPAAELDGNGNVTARFIYGTRSNVPDYLIKGGMTYRLIADHLGSPRLVIDATTGHIVQRLAYDAFGRVTFDDNPGFQPFGFAGGLYDPDTKLTRFGARDYDAETGRWTAKDPILFGGGDTNLYGYALNDPVNWLDPLGLEQVRNGIIYDDAGNLIDEVGLAAPHPLADPINWLSGGLTGLIKGSAVKAAAACPVGPERLVIGKLKDLHKPGALKAGERLLDWSWLRNTKLDWKENSSQLREAIREGRPIRDASVDPIGGELIDNTGFLRAERNLLKNHGWRYNSSTNLWSPPN